MDLATGNTIWENTTDTPLSFGKLSVTRDLVVASANDGAALVALDRRNGTLRWEQRNAVTAPVTAPRTTAVFGTLIWAMSRHFDNDENPTGITIDAYKLGTGARVFSRGISQTSGDTLPSSPPVVIDGRVYVSIRDGAGISEHICLTFP